MTRNYLTDDTTARLVLAVGHVADEGRGHTMYDVVCCHELLDELNVASRSFMGNIWHRAKETTT